MASDDDLVLLLAQFHNDIPFFAQQAFGVELNPKQVEFVTKYQRNSQITFRGGIGFGKTFSMAVLIHWALITHNDVQVTIFGPSEDQIKAGIWKEVGNLYAKLPPYLKESLDYTATKLYRRDNPTGAFAETRLANKDNVETARGIHQKNNFVFVDEATGVPDAVFAELQNIFTDPNPKLCIISNPSRTNGFFFDTWEHPEISKEWTPVHGKLTDNPGITPERLRSITASFGGVGSNEYRVKVLGEFPLEDEDGVIPRDIVVEAIERDVLARIAANVKRYGKSANGSNTSNVQTIVGALGAIGVPVGGVLAGNTALVMSSLGSMATTGAAAKIGDRLLTNPTVVSLVANLPRAQVQRGGIERTIAALHQYAGSPGVDDATRAGIVALTEAISARNEKKAK